jgi:hypothetical protein
MKTYAVIRNDMVVNTVIAEDDWVSLQTDTLIEYTEENPAYIGGDYTDGFFYTPKPYASWIKLAGEWIAPIPMPEDAEEGLAWIWNENTQEWETVEIPEARTVIGDFLD